MKRQMNHDELIDSLAEQLNMPDRVVISNIAIGSKWLYRDVPIPDVMMFRKSYTRPDLSIYDIKVTRQDFLSDINKGKYRKYFRICNRFYFAVPFGLVKKSEVPEGVGLYVCNPETGSWSTQVAAKRWEGKLDRIEWMSVLFSLRENQARLRSLEERLIMSKNVELEDIARNLPSKFRDIIYKHRTAVEELENRRKELSELLGTKNESWYEIEDKIRTLKEKEGWNAKEDVEFALKILDNSLNSRFSEWQTNDLLAKAEEFIERNKKRVQDKS